MKFNLRLAAVSAAGGGFSDDHLLGNNFAVDLTIATNILQEQAAGCLTHEARLILDGRELGCDITGMHIVGKADKGHIVGNAEA